MIRVPDRISKKEAKKLFQNNEKFIVVPCKCPPTRWSYPKPGETPKKIPFDLAIICNPESEKEFFNEFHEVGDIFEAFCDHFTYYNCTNEVGRYPAFYRMSALEIA